MNRKSLLGVVVVGVLLVTTAGLAQDAEPAPAPAARLGAGGSFALGAPIFDFFAEVPTGDFTAFRFTLGTWFAFAGNMAFSLDGSFMIRLGEEGFQPYFGFGAGGLAVVAGGISGVAQINLSVNGLAGAYIAMSDTAGFFGQVRLLGLINLANMQINALLMPGLGLYVMF
ncbi:MAG: hypothetical protein ACP5G2_02230 [Candidatus Bipolaricaulaceae bacterium]